MSKPLFESCKSMESVLCKMYLDYKNNYISVETFAADNLLTINDANTLIIMGRKYHEQSAKLFSDAVRHYAKISNIKL